MDRNGNTDPEITPGTPEPQAGAPVDPDIIAGAAEAAAALLNREGGDQ
ncbi:hypothetical protein SAMN05428942_7301 [Streptomyces sp. 2112.2]|nr:hypothetical protein SAMN05428942_7301 [Streptomyces sp. 2112.2]